MDELEKTTSPAKAGETSSSSMKDAEINLRAVSELDVSQVKALRAVVQGTVDWDRRPGGVTTAAMQQSTDLDVMARHVKVRTVKPRKLQALPATSPSRRTYSRLDPRWEQSADNRLTT